MGQAASALHVSEGHDFGGRVAVITGASSGIGKETARVLLLRGARVVIPVRSIDKGEAVKKELQDEYAAATRDVLAPNCIVMFQCDLSSLQSVKSFATEVLAAFPKIDLLINNAGVFIDKYVPSCDGLDTMWVTNYLSHFLLTEMLLPALKAAAPSRIVHVSSEAAWVGPLDIELLPPTPIFSKVGGMPPVRHYGMSKLCQVLHNRQLNHLLGGAGVTSFVLHPGSMINTDIGRDSVGTKIMMAALSPFTKSIGQGAATTIYCCIQALPSQHNLFFQDCGAIPNRLPQADDDAAAEKLWNLSSSVLRLWESKGLSLVQATSLFPSHRDLPPSSSPSFNIVCRIESTSINGEGSEQHAVYNIESSCRTGEMSKKIHRRFREFVALRKQLLEQFSEYPLPLPELPPKTVLSSTEPSLLQQRRAM